MHEFISWIGPNHIDPAMFSITERYLLAQVIFFLFFGVWIMVPIIIRCVQIWFNYLLINGYLKKTEDLRSIREQLQSNLFRKTKWAVDSFHAFRIAWEDARLRREDKAVLPIRFREFLSPEIVLDGARNRRIAEALPGIFVGLGIFGTFLGLVLGLRGLEFGKLETLQAGVGHLISGLSLAFLTSLFGIAMSIVFSVLYRLFVSGLERSVFKIDNLLCRLYPFESQERFARKHYELQEDIKHGLQTLATDVATQISGRIGVKLGQAIDEHMIPVMKDLQLWIKNYMEENRKQQDAISTEFQEHLLRLSQVITQHFKNSQEKQSEVMGSVLEQYAKALTETFQDQFSSMGKIIEDTTKAQQEIKQQLVEFSDTLRNQLQAQAEMIEKTNRAGEILGQSLDSLETIAQKLKASSEDISSAAELLERSAMSAKEGQEVLSHTMLQQIEAMAQTRNELERAWGIVTGNAQTLVEQVSRTIQDLTIGVSENLIKALDSFDSKVAEVVERFSGTLFDASETISEMPGIMVGINSSLEAINDGINEQKVILTDIRETSKGVFAENIQMVSDASINLGECTVNMSATATALRDFLGAFNEKITDSAESFDQRHSKALADLNSVIELLVEELKKNNAFIGADSPLFQILQHLSELSPAGTNEDTDVGIAERISRQINMLCDRLEDIFQTISVFTEKNPVRSNPEILDRISLIDQHVARISIELKQQMLPQLEILSRSMDSISGSLEGLKKGVERDEEGSKGWRQLFGRSVKK